MKFLKTELMEVMRFEPISGSGSDGLYWHPFFSRDVIFDISASGSDVNSIMAHVFRRAIEVGQEEKIKEIKKVLEIK